MRRVALVIALGGCVRWTAPQVQQARIPSTVIELRRDQLPGSGALLPDGRFRFQVDVAHLCRKTELVRERESVVEDKRLTGLGKVIMLTGAVMVLVGVKFLTEGYHGTADGLRPPRTKGGVVFASQGSVILGAPLYNRFVDSRRGSVVIDRTIPTSAVDLPCEGAPSAVLGELDVVTPWGTRARSSIGSDGVALFTLAWANLDPQLLSSAWQVRSTSGLTAAWVPAALDLEIATPLISR
jgi:hypothetical protein